jgi:glucose 1-dehydrogenase
MLYIVNIVNTVVDKFGSLDILVNNAGIQKECPSHEIETKDFDQVIAVNLRGAYLCARETLKHLLSQNRLGVIINISSVHEIIPRPMYVSYSISKGGMENLRKINFSLICRSCCALCSTHSIRSSGVGK